MEQELNTYKNSILFVTRSGILRRILPVALASTDLTVNQDIKAITLYQDNPKYVFWYCKYNEKDIRNKCSKEGTTVESIETSRLKKYKIPMCPVREQNIIVKKIEVIMSIINSINYSIRKSILEAGQTRTGILKKAFEGRLVSQDSKDEPASVLLERIKNQKIKQRKLK